MILVWIILLALVSCVAVFIIKQNRYYSRLFSREHFEEFYTKFVSAIQSVEQCPDNPADPVPASFPSFVTSAGLAVGVSSSLTEDGQKQLHISISQAGRPTTHSVASRFGFILITILNGNPMSLFPFYTESDIHHLVMVYDLPKLQINSFEKTLAHYTSHYEPIPYVFQQVSGK